MVTMSVGAIATETMIITPGQFAPVTADPRFELFGIGEGIEWVAGEATEWIAGVDVPTRAKLASLVVYCLDNVEANAVVRLYRVKGDGSAPEEIEAVATGGTREEPGTGFLANDRLRTAKRVDRHAYHYFIRAMLPPRPDDVHGILRITGVQLEWER
jgi:hypothetical protein